MAKVLVMIANEQTSKFAYQTALQTVKEFNTLHSAEMFTVQENKTDVLSVYLETESVNHSHLYACLFGQAFQTYLQINRL
jgi:hypothetical protein